jgi:hypothetical protein
MLPKKLFLLDGFGALLSAFLLGLVLVKFKSIFGIPLKTLYLLAFFPLLFVIYDFFCFTMVKKSFSPFLKVLAYANIMYCILSLTMVIYHFEKIKTLGWIYILLEILIVVLLAIIELKTAIQLEDL